MRVAEEERAREAGQGERVFEGEGARSAGRTHLARRLV